MKKALVTGALGQDGSYLCEYLLSQGYQVFGMVRRDVALVPHIGVEYIYGDLRDELSLLVAIRKTWPDEIYNLAGQVYVPVSWDIRQRRLM
jgi:GDPmannose 4,6-dehydratase